MELRIEQLSKSYGKTQALNGFSFTFREGIYGILGPNGAGKSTLMNSIATLIRPDTGEIRYNSIPVLKDQKSYLKKIGYMPQTQTMYPEFTGREYLQYIGSLKGMTNEDIRLRSYDLLGKLGLSSVRNHRISTYSGGMKQRLLLAQALLSDPEILLLDEPTAGLDPRQRIAVRNIISELGRDKIILISTHIVSDIAPTSKECLLLKNGQLEAYGSQKDLCGQLKGKVWTVHCSYEDLESLQSCGFVSEITPCDPGIAVRIVAEEKPSFPCAETDANLDDVYLYHFGEETL